MDGTIFSIEEFSVYDGPGIRTSVFLKGCPLRCTWCHNPEGQEREICIVRSPNGCIDCKACIRAAVRAGEGLRFTEESIQKCPMHLLRTCGEVISSADLVARVLKNERLLKDGGITFSGGEPLAQSEFVMECMELLKGRLHTAIQTSGYCPEETFLRILKKADYFLYDLKLADPTLHKRYTGVSNECIQRNLKSLAHSGKAFVLRIPLIPGVTDTEENISGIAEILVKNHISYAELLPYNKMAGGKYAMLMRKYVPGFDETIPVKYRSDLFEKYNIQIKIL